MGITYFQHPPGLNSWWMTCTFLPLGAHHCIICSGRVQASHTVAIGALKDRLIDKIRLLKSFGFSMLFIFPALQLVYIVLESIDPPFPQALITPGPIGELFQFSRTNRAKGFPPFPMVSITWHSSNILICCEIAGRLILKCSAIVRRFMGCSESNSMIFLLVGSAIAWKMSRLDSVVIISKRTLM